MSALPQTESPTEILSNPLRANDAIFSGDEADVDGETPNVRRTSANTGITSHDFEDGTVGKSKGHRFRKERSKKKAAKALKKMKRADRIEKRKQVTADEEAESAGAVSGPLTGPSTSSGPHVGFMSEVQEIPDTNAGKRPFNMRNISSAVRPTLPKGLASTVFTHHEAIGRSMPVPATRPGVPRPATSASSAGVRRASSLPDIHKSMSGSRLPQPVGPQASYPPIAPTQSQASVDEEDIVDDKKHLSQTSAILLLLFSTGLVAICAEFLVDSIDYLVNNSGVSQAFVGLIILPIVGNAAEHVTAVTVATKNKMDLAINVAVGSSIQIALFVTPLIVILGWIIGRDMSLYFSLFETVSLFASAFIVSLLLIDGRTNYLEGALLIAAYIIIAVAAFFYPTCDLSLASGPADSTSSC
jgi:Ca2+:H+ antiporter